MKIEIELNGEEWSDGEVFVDDFGGVTLHGKKLDMPNEAFDIIEQKIKEGRKTGTFECEGISVSWCLTE